MEALKEPSPTRHFQHLSDYNMRLGTSLYSRPSTMVGKRSYQNTLVLFRDLSRRMSLETISLITTDGFGFYEKVVGRLFGSACVISGGMKRWRSSRARSF